MKHIKQMKKEGGAYEGIRLKSKQRHLSKDVTKIELASGKDRKKGFFK